MSLTTRSMGRSRAPWLAACAMLLLSGCGGGAPGSPAASESPVTSAAASVTPSPSSEGSQDAEPSESLVAVCLPADVLGAVEDISQIVEPTVPLDEIADAVEALDLSDRDDELVEDMQEDLVALLREGRWNAFAAQVAAGVLLQRANLTEC